MQLYAISTEDFSKALTTSVTVLEKDFSLDIQLFSSK